MKNKAQRTEPWEGKEGVTLGQAGSFLVNRSYLVGVDKTAGSTG